MQALEWIPKVIDSERTLYEQNAKKYFKDFYITERAEQGTMIRAKERKEYFPVYYVVPEKGNEAAIGFDLASNTTRKATLIQAITQRQTLATAKITLVQEKSQQSGFLVFLPLYDERNELLGFILGVFRVTDILTAALDSRSKNDIAIMVEDLSAEKNKQLLFMPKNKLNAKSSLKYQTKFEIAGRTWQVTNTPSSGYYLITLIWKDYLILSTIFCLTFISLRYLQLGSKIKEKTNTINSC